MPFLPCTAPPSSWSARINAPGGASDRTQKSEAAAKAAQARGKGEGSPRGFLSPPFPLREEVMAGKREGEKLAGQHRRRRKAGGSWSRKSLSSLYPALLYSDAKSPFFPCANGVLHPLHAVADLSQLPYRTHPVSCFPALTLLEKKGESKGLLLPPSLTPAGIITQKPHAGI